MAVSRYPLIQPDEFEDSEWRLRQFVVADKYKNILLELLPLQIAQLLCTGAHDSIRWRDVVARLAVNRTSAIVSPWALNDSKKKKKKNHPERSNCATKT